LLTGPPLPLPVSIAFGTATSRSFDLFYRTGSTTVYRSERTLLRCRPLSPGGL